VALLIVYWAKTVLSHAGENAPKVGEYGRTDANAPRTPTAIDDLDPAMAANANLVEQMRSYKEQLETIAAQKVAIEKQLADAQKAPPEGARAFVYGGVGCWERTTRTVGPRSPVAVSGSTP